MVGCCYCKPSYLDELPKEIKKNHKKVIKQIKKDKTFKSKSNTYA